jgi:hypothetical protein
VNDWNAIIDLGVDCALQSHTPTESREHDQVSIADMSRKTRQRYCYVPDLFFPTIVLVFGLFVASCTQESDPPNVLFIAVDDLNTDLARLRHFPSFPSHFLT